jgi:hypothetical protein
MKEHNGEGGHKPVKTCGENWTMRYYHSRT